MTRSVGEQAQVYFISVEIPMHENEERSAVAEPLSGMRTNLKYLITTQPWHMDRRSAWMIALRLVTARDALIL